MPSFPYLHIAAIVLFAGCLHVFHSREHAPEKLVTMTRQIPDGQLPLRSSSEARLNHSTIHTEGGPVGRGGQRAAYVSHHIGHLFGRGEPLQE